MDILNSTDAYTLKWLILRYMNFTLISKMENREKINKTKINNKERKNKKKKENKERQSARAWV